MSKKILLFDIGNTSIKVGMADPGSVFASYSLPGTQPGQGGHTADSLGLAILGLLAHAGLAAGDIAACVASSVVPGLDPILARTIGRYLGCPLHFVPRDLPVPMQNLYERPAEVGADRLVGAYAARRLLPGEQSLMVVDFGTALTFDCINKDAYLGGLIFPGPDTALAALAKNTAKLPHAGFEVETSDPAPCRDTATSIRHGIVFGYACLVEGLVERLARQMPGRVHVLATGGLAREMARLVRVFNSVEPVLLLDGLRRLYYELANKP